MRRTYQTEERSCLSACLASILELPLDFVPRFAQETKDLGLSGWDWFAYMNRWLNEKLDISCISLQLPSPDAWKALMPFTGYTIGVLDESPRLDPHAVVCYRGIPIFNPDRSRASKLPDWTDLDHYYLLVPVYFDVYAELQLQGLHGDLKRSEF